MKVEESIGTSISCLDDEDMIDKAYSGLLACLDLVKPDKRGLIGVKFTDGRKGHARKRDREDMDVFLPLLDGVYIPGSQRNYWRGYIDPVDFPLPESGCVYIDTDFNDVLFEFITVKKINKLPKSLFCKCNSPQFSFKTYRTLCCKNGDTLVNKNYFAVDINGGVYSAINRIKLRNTPYRASYLRHLDIETDTEFSAGAISLLADRRYLWNIRTSEESYLKGLQAIVDFGVEEEMVKSLVFARDEPMTQSGRKRPILHWVRAHKRRLKHKIDIDVSKHLRGITEFKMGDLEFKITSPQKPKKRQYSGRWRDGRVSQRQAVGRNGAGSRR